MKIATYTQILKEAGFKLTPQRIAIAEYLTGNTDHPSANKIFKELKPRFSQISMATVYNTLNMMVKLNLVNEVKLVKDQIYYDPNTSTHHHFHCNQCQTIVDINEPDVFPNIKTFENKTHNRVDQVKLILTGTCESCL